MIWENKGYGKPEYFHYLKGVTRGSMNCEELIDYG